MDTGQTMFTIGALALLAIVITNVNTRFLTTNSIMSESKFGVVGVSLATSLIEEASGKSFDLYTSEGTVTSPSELTYSLGPAGGEVYPDFNDFDDFNGLVKVDSTMPSAVFTAECAVDYVERANPDVAIDYPTWHKRLSVIVTSPSTTDTVRMSSIYSYFYFR